MEWEWLYSGVLGAVLGGGAIAGIGYRALKDKLEFDLAKTFVPRAEQVEILMERGVFQTRSEAKRMADKVEAWGNLTSAVSGRVDVSRDQLVELRESERHRTDSLTKFLSRIDGRLDSHEQQLRELSTAMTKTATLLDEITRRMERSGR